MSFDDQIKRLNEQKVAIAKQLAELTVSVTHPPNKEAKKKLAGLKLSLNFVISAHKALLAANETSLEKKPSQFLLCTLLLKKF